MESRMDAALRHARNYARYLSRCGSTYMIQIALKELGIPSGRDGFHFAKKAVQLLQDSPTTTLTNGVYMAAGLLSGSTAEDKQVEQAIRKAIQIAWKDRDEEIWSCYFPAGRPGRSECPSNKEFLMAVVDFIELWKAFCEEVNYGRE